LEKDLSRGGDSELEKKKLDRCAGGITFSKKNPTLVRPFKREKNYGQKKHSRLIFQGGGKKKSGENLVGGPKETWAFPEKGGERK